MVPCDVGCAAELSLRFLYLFT